MQTWLASEFPRTQQTASLLMGDPPPPLVIDARLNELDYGEFEGRPFLEYAAWLERPRRWPRPPGAGESQQEGIRRMLVGASPRWSDPARASSSCHGLLVSVLLWHRDRSPETPMPLFFPEAPYVEPLAVPDDELSDWFAVLLNELESATSAARSAPTSVKRGEFRIGDGSAIATVDSVSRPPDQKDLPHA